MKKSLVLLFLILVAYLPTVLLAQTVDCRATDGVCNPAGSESNVTFEGFLGKILKYSLGFVGGFSLLIFMYAGVIWMTAGGKSDKLQKARDTMLWSVLGLLVVFTSYSILTFVLGLLNF